MILELGKVVDVNVHEARPNEASHFTPWLASADGQDLLQDALDMDMGLEVEATEQLFGHFKADMVAMRTNTPDEHLVLIECKEALWAA